MEVTVRVPVMTRKDFSRGNPGDAFICLGLQALMEQEFGPLEWFYLDKFSKQDFVDNLGVLRESKFLIYAGTPQYGNYEDAMFWYDWGVWKDILIPEGIQFHSIAGGSYFPSTSMTTQAFSDYCLGSIRTKNILNERKARMGLCTVRDPYSHRLLTDLGMGVPLLLCTATWAGRYYGLSKMSDEYVAIVPPNPKGIHPPSVGLRTLQEVERFVQGRVQNLVRGFEQAGKKPVVVCHTYGEVPLFQELFPTFCSNDPVAMLRFYSRCQTVVSARLHACLPAVGLGVKNVVSVPIDTRGSAASHFGISEVHLRDLSYDTVEAALESCVEIDLAPYEKEYQSLFNQHFSKKVMQ